MKTFSNLILIIFSFPILLFGQLTDDFSDNDFTNNPAWQGNTNLFTVTEGELRLNNESPSSSNVSYLSIEAATSLNDLTSWRFYVALDFSPSSSNNARVYLMSNLPDLSGELNGYYLQIGGVSGSMDSLELYRQDGSSSTRLAAGLPGNVGSGPITAFIEVQRDQNGNWEISTNYSDRTDVTLEFTAVDNTYSVANYFGFYCRYSSTRGMDFGFDDVFISPLFVDREPPVLSSAEAINSTAVSLTFNEAINPVSLTNLDNFTLTPGSNNIVSATLDEANPSRVTVAIDPPLISTTTYTISIQNIEDANGNPAILQSQQFTYFDIQAAQIGDLIVTEIMADPSPTVGLPEFEYFELYNRSNKVIELSTLSVSTGGSARAISDFLLLPNTYVTICDADAVEAFSVFGPAAAIGAFPSLSDGGDEIVITNEAEEVVLDQFYDDAWYDVDSLDDGGYSLELLQLDGPLDCPSNWIASRSVNGGSPGMVNNEMGIEAETIPPALLDLEIESDFEIRITFSEQMDGSSVIDPNNYSFSPTIEIANIIPGEDNEFLLVLNDALQASTTYSFTIGTAIQDCIGNTIDTPIENIIGLPQAIAPGDLIINEVLFFPFTGGSDFVEFRNVSNKIINLKGLLLENTLKESGNTLQEITVNKLVFPGDFVVITPNPEDILQSYTVPSPDLLIDNSLPTLDNNEGNITLRQNELIIDAFDYEDDFHLSLLENDRGVSLERLSPDQPTQSAGNWHSASQAVGFATPTGPNSQNFDLTQLAENLVTIENPRFSPDDDGFEDVLLIQINPSQPGFVTNIKIFDAQGRLINDLVQNTLLGNTALFKWDGFTNENSKARIGPYIVWVELFDVNGNVSTEKITVVVAGKL